MLRPLSACLLPSPGLPLGDLSPSIALARLPIAYGGTIHNQPLFTTSLARHTQLLFDERFCVHKAASDPQDHCPICSLPTTLCAQRDQVKSAPASGLQTGRGFLC